MNTYGTAYIYDLVTVVVVVCTYMTISNYNKLFLLPSLSAGQAQTIEC